jgi:hypothetical protein
MAAAVVVERAAVGVQQALSRRVTERYRPLVQRAIAGDETARRELLRSPARYRLALAWLLIEPLIEDRDPERIARTRAIVEAMSVLHLADRYLRSWLWWRRALALRALGLLQARDYTAQLVAALDDPHPDVRAAALDALTDQHDPAALQAVVVRLHDTSLHRGRRGAALKAFGSDCEPFLLEWSEVDPENRLNYIHALAICGTARSRPVLCRWTRDTRIDVRATAFEALAYVGLDDEAARVALKDWRATIQASGRWRPTRCGVGRARATRPPASRRISTIRGGRRPRRANASVRWGLRLSRVAGPRLAPGPRRPARAPDVVAGERSPLMSFLARCAIAFSLLITAYFVLWNVSQIAMSPLAAVTLWRHGRRYTRRARRWLPVSRCRRSSRSSCPAYNEELTIVDSLRAFAGARLRGCARSSYQRRVLGRHAGASATDLPTRARTAGVRSAAALPSRYAVSTGRSASPDLVVGRKRTAGCKSTRSMPA